jgi:hypothetical protein
MNKSLVIWQRVDGVYRVPDNVSRLEAAVEDSNLLEKLLSCAYRALRRSLLC